jgi:photosystem II stability/assembly factor-like uncharacterized protein
LIFYAFCTIGASAQWTWRNPLPQGNDLFVIKANNENSIWAAGNVGTLMHSTDGGLNWDLRNVIGHTKTVKFTGIDFPEDSVGFIVDAYGYIFKSTDAGATWDSVYWEMDKYLLASCFTDTQHGYIVCSGGKILRTTDGGNLWSPYYFNEPVDLLSICFPSSQTGYAAGFGYILKTSDAGDTWTAVYFDSTAVFKSIVFSSFSEGFAADDYGHVLKTTDGGTTWTSWFFGDTIRLESIGMFSSDTLILNGFSDPGGMFPSTPLKYRTTDGGNTWTLLQIPENLPFVTAVATCAGGTGYFAGSFGSLVKTVDYGTTWTSLSNLMSPPISWGMGIYEIFNGLVLKTTDGGDTWIELDTMFNNHFLRAVDFVTEDVGCIGGDNIYSTFDGGQTWILRMSGLGWYGIRSISFAGTSTCIAVGWDGLFLRSTDLGQSWTYVSGVPNVNFNVVCFANETTGYAAGTSTILKTTDGGATWGLISAEYTLTSLDFTSPERGIGVGLNGLIILTTDGGLSWDQMGPWTPYSLFDVDFYDTDTGYIAGGFIETTAFVLKTTDGGLTWHDQFIPTNFAPFSIATSGSSAFAGGWFGHLLGTTNGGISVSSGPWVKPKGMFISVYPNPTSSSITIETPYPGQLSILTLSGQVLLTSQVTESKSIVDISSLPGGAYVVTIVGEKGMGVGKFVKE